jgi:hypothetical protein
MILKFPYSAARRACARRPRRSKNGTPEERAAKKALAAANLGSVIDLNRRAVLAGAAAAIPASAALALPALDGPDPTFAAIEAHKEAWLKWSELLHAPEMEGCHWPGRKAAEEAAGDFCHIETEAAIALSYIVPTTMGGVLALLGYIDSFNLGKLTYGGRSFSEYYTWPDEELDDESITRANGQPLTLSWSFWIMRNVHEALSRLTAGHVS